MHNYIPFYTRIWSDKKIRKLSGEATTLFIYLFANEAITLTGIYELDKELCEVRLKSKLNDKFEQAFQEVIKSGLIEWDEDKETIWVVNRFKLIPSNSSSKSPKVLAGAINELNSIDHPFKDKFLDKYKDMLKDELWRLHSDKYKYDKEYFVQPENISSFTKHYDNRKELKRFIINRTGYSEQKIDEIIARVLPNLK